jgi:hypothetical protein
LALTREQIIAAYRHLLAKSPDQPPGIDKFVGVVFGVSTHQFRGGIWRRWSAFQADVGITPNVANKRVADEEIAAGFALLARKLGRLPTQSDLVFARKRDPSVPSDGAIKRRAITRDARIKMLRKFCADRPEFADVLALLDGDDDAATKDAGNSETEGFVYLQKSGRRYKIGWTAAPERRRAEVQTLSPDPVSLVHLIPTDDPGGVEAYWKNRFKKKNIRDEWYNLTSDDVAAFKRWKSQ